MSTSLAAVLAHGLASQLRPESHPDLDLSMLPTDEVRELRDLWARIRRTTHAPAHPLWGWDLSDLKDDELDRFEALVAKVEGRPPPELPDAWVNRRYRNTS